MEKATRSALASGDPAVVPFDNSVDLRPGRECLDGISDSDLEALPVTVVAHALGTIGNRGHQVIDGRTTSLPAMIAKTETANKTAASMFVGLVGSAPEWPSAISSPFPRGFFGGQPILSHASVEEMSPAKPESISIRVPAKFSIIQKCLTNGIAAISVLCREDVMGDAEKLAECIGRLWGVPASVLLECARATPVLQADLRRVFIASDEISPQIIAPATIRRGISVAASAASSDVFGPNVLIDYQRARTAPASSFYNSSCIEERSLARPTIRPGTMTSRWNASSGTLHYFVVAASQKLFSPSMFSGCFGAQVTEMDNWRVTETALEELMAVFTSHKSLFAGSVRCISDITSPPITQAILQGVGASGATNPISQEVDGLSIGTRAHRVSSIIGVVLSKFVTEMGSTSMSVMTWLRGIELAGVFLFKA